MKTHRRIIVLGAAAGIWMAGCQQPVKQASQTNQANALNQPAAASNPADSDAASEALAWKAQNYAKEIGPLIDARAGVRSSTNPSAQPEKSQVTWLDPADFRLGGAYAVKSDETKNAAVVRPVITTTPGSANQPITVDSAPEKSPAKEAKIEVATNETKIPGELVSSTISPRPAPITSDSLAEKLERRVKDYPRDVDAQLEYQLFNFLRDESSPQLSTLSSLPGEDRELISAVMDGLVNLRATLRSDSNMLLSRKIKPMLDMSDRLRSQSDLTIPTMVLCKSVTNFANYEPIEPARFPATQDHQVIVYCEVGNFTSNLNDKQLWQTRLTWDLTLFTEMGMQVWSDKTETIDDASRTRRRDFFVRKIITLPKNLTIGRYLLKATLVDTQSNRVAEATTPIVIAAQ